MKFGQRSIHGGLSFDEDVAQLIDELNYDIMFMYSIIGTPRESFGLTGWKLLYAVHKTIMAITRAGARPVRAATQPGVRFPVATDYGDTPEEITRTFMRRWQAGGYETNGGDNDIWFAGPEQRNQPWSEAELLREQQWLDRDRPE